MLPKFTVETDASYIKGMLNNPDIQPGAAVNRWIAGILLFDFDLVHVHVFVVQCKMMMRFGSQRDNGRHLREDRQGKTTHREY